MSSHRDDTLGYDSESVLPVHEERQVQAPHARMRSAQAAQRQSASDLHGEDAQRVLGAIDNSMRPMASTSI